MRILVQVSCLILLLNSILICSCQHREQTTRSAHAIIQESVKVHGGISYEMMDISFDFRKYRIRLKQDHGQFIYERSYKDSSENKWIETLDNEGLSIRKNDSNYIPTDSARSQKQEGLNAIAYFALVPFKLADPAVIATYAGTITIEGKQYDKVSVTFKKEDGGQDHHDEFCYWIDQETHQLSYLAYSNGGPRFRKAIRSHPCGGITIQDYENYAMTDTSINTETFDSAFIQGKFKLLSMIEQANFNDNLKPSVEK